MPNWKVWSFKNKKPQVRNWKRINYDPPPWIYKLHMYVGHYKCYNKKRCNSLRQVINGIFKHTSNFISFNNKMFQQIIIEENKNWLIYPSKQLWQVSIYVNLYVYACILRLHACTVTMIDLFISSSFMTRA